MNELENTIHELVESEINEEQRKIDLIEYTARKLFRSMFIDFQNEFIIRLKSELCEKL